MQFKENQAIYLQIADLITENILTGRWKEEERIPSVREMAVFVEVNPNTTARTYSYLQSEGIIKNKRGVGYFVTQGGMGLAKESRRENFINNELPVLFKSLDLLGIDCKMIETLYKKHGKQEIA